MKSGLMNRRRAKVAQGGNDAWVTDRDQNADAKPPAVEEVPRLAAAKTAQPMPPASPAAPAAAAPAAAAPAPAATPVTQPGNGNISSDLKQMSSETLANIISAISKKVDMNDKAALDFIEALTKELKGRPVETNAEVAKASSANDLYDDNPGAVARLASEKDIMDTPKTTPLGLNLASAEGKEAAGGTWWVWDQDTGKITENQKEVPEAAEAHGLVDEAPAKLDRPATTVPEKLAAEAMKASTAVKKAEKLAERLKDMYLEAKDIVTVNDSRQVREAVESIYQAYERMGCAAKALGKQQMQEESEASAMDVKGKAKKKSALDCLVLASAEEDEDEDEDEEDSVVCPKCHTVVRKGGRCGCGETEN